jgi:serine-type D-Ala-D-Ala carboxypeptidase/endopeptidase (penicillin-binding protein 4)
MSFLNRKLSLTQVLAVVGISIVLVALGTAYYFAPPANDAAVLKASAGMDSTGVPAAVRMPDTTALSKLRAAVDSLGLSEKLAHGGFGFYLATTDSGKVLCEFSSKRSLVPASVLKTITTGTALALLGPGYRFTTVLQHDGEVEDKVLKGNIYIRGGGDPTLGSDVFGSTSADRIMEKWLEEIKKLGVDTIEGSIIGDADLYEYDLVPAGWAWEDMQSDYCAGACGLSFRENMYEIEVICSGSSTVCRVRPEVPGLKLYNQVRMNKETAKSYAFVMGAPYMNERVVLGEANSSFEAKSTVPDPAFFCAYTLYRYLQKNGITVKDSCTTMRKLKQAGKYEKKERKAFHTTYSPSLEDIVAHTNAVSQNFYAETLLKAMSVQKSGYGSTTGGVAAVIEYWKPKGIDLRGFYMVDGSGVSRFNSITPRQLTEMLIEYSRDTRVFPSLYNSLPKAGYGSTADVCAGTSAQDNVRFKSGYMTRVRCFTGYVDTKKGKRLAFTMMANNYLYEVQEMRNQLEHLMVLMAELD